jgi:uncharacterized protein (TIRG00374 family)
LTNKLSGLLKILLPLLLGIFLIWYFFKDLTQEDKTQIIQAFRDTNYFWILISLFFGVLSHISRAYRWKYTLEPLGYKPAFYNSLFAVLIGYMINLAVPRLGEVSRCGILAKYENLPFNKLFGTVIAERVADFFILMAFTATVVIIQLSVIQSLVDEILGAWSQKFQSGKIVFAVLAILGIVSILLYYFVIRKLQIGIVQKLNQLLFGVYEGLKSIFVMKNKWKFLAHTVFIWAMYLLMFYLCFFSLPETNNVPFGGILTAFVLGGFTIVATNGGIGAFPLAIQAVLLLYEVDKNIGGAFGWIVWTAQTALLLLLGVMSFVLLPIFNAKFKKDELA